MDKQIKANFANKVKTPAQKATLNKMLTLDKKLDKSVGAKKGK